MAEPVLTLEARIGALVYQVSAYMLIRILFKMAIGKEVLHYNIP